MLDIKFIRENPDKIKEACRNKQVKVDIDRLLELDEQRRQLLQRVEQLRSERNMVSHADVKVATQALERARELKKEIQERESDLAKIEEDLNTLMFRVPNLPLDDVPVGKDDTENVVAKKVGGIPKFDFQPKDHLGIGEALGLIDIKRAAKVAGTRFGYFKKEAVLLQFALINFAFDFLVKKGFIPILPPVMMKSEKMRGMGYLEQTDVEEAYHLPQDDLFLVGTSEQPIGAMHADETFEEKDLPRRYVGFSTCFRREAGSYGKDTRGVFRVHQFDKVEMFIFSKPEDSVKEHQLLLSSEEELMKALKLPYQVVKICTGDLGLPAAAKYDIEAWLPDQNKYRETHSTSNCTDFQARRLNIKYRDSKTKKTAFVHTLNGTALAMGRTIIAILENYQQKDGSVKVPKVLQKYLDFKKIPPEK